MAKIIRERYEDGVLVERHIEGSNFKPWRWTMLFIHLIIAVSLATIALITVRDNMAYDPASQEEASPARCDAARIQS